MTLLQRPNSTAELAETPRRGEFQNTASPLCVSASEFTRRGGRLRDSSPLVCAPATWTVWLGCVDRARLDRARRGPEGQRAPSRASPLTPASPSSLPPLSAPLAPVLGGEGQGEGESSSQSPQATLLQRISGGCRGAYSRAYSPPCIRAFKKTNNNATTFRIALKNQTAPDNSPPKALPEKLDSKT